MGTTKYPQAEPDLKCLVLTPRCHAYTSPPESIPPQSYSICYSFIDVAILVRGAFDNTGILTIEYVIVTVSCAAISA